MNRIENNKNMINFAISKYTPHSSIADVIISAVNSPDDYLNKQRIMSAERIDKRHPLSGMYIELPPALFKKRAQTNPR